MTFERTQGGGPEETLRLLVDKFAALEGRQPRVMVSPSRNSPEEDKVKSISVVLAGCGFDVDIGIPYESSGKLGLNAIENDSDVLILHGLDPDSSQSFVSELHAYLSNKGYSDMLILHRENEIKVPALFQRLELWLIEALR